MSKYLWIAHEGNYSGANRAALEFTDVLVQKGNKVVWLLPSKSSFAGVLESKGYNVHIIGFYNWTIRLSCKKKVGWIIKTTLRNVKSIFSITRYIKHGSFDYVVSNTICFYVGAVAARIDRKKHIWLIHEFGEEDHGIMPWVGARGYDWLGKLSMKVVVNSEAVREKFSQFVDRNKLLIQKNMITISKEPKECLNHKGEQLRLLILGQIAPSKGHLDAIQAIAMLGAHAKKVRLSIMGSVDESSYYERIRHFVDISKLSDVVTFYGPTEHPLDEIIKHDLLLMCSQSEAYGRVTEEAMRLGVPVIGRNSGNTKYMIRDGVNGFIYNNENELQQILMNLINKSISVFELSKSTLSYARNSFKVTSMDVMNSFTVHD
jgi:glycosyltransferase involved in cell wall biosynthesis